MNPEEKQELERLCQAVIQEKDSAKLTRLIAELNDFLERRERKDNGACQKSSDARTA